MEQPHDKAPAHFTLMCALVLVGNLFLLLANLFKEAMLATAIQQGGVGTEASFYLPLLLHGVLLSCMGAMLGGVLMLLRKRSGYTIYALSIGLHLVLAVCAMGLWAMTVYFIFVSVIIAFYCLIPLFFLLYFRRHREWLRLSQPL